VLHEGRQGHGEGPGEITDAGRPLAEPPQHGPARGIGERQEHLAERVLILFHEAKYHGKTVSSRANLQALPAHDQARLNHSIVIAGLDPMGVRTSGDALPSSETPNPGVARRLHPTRAQPLHRHARAWPWHPRVAAISASAAYKLVD